MMDREGNKLEKLVSCVKDDCIEPAVSPDDLKIAYSKLAREGAAADGGIKNLVDRPLCKKIELAGR